MSIVIAALEKNVGINILGDRRMVLEDKSSFYNKVVEVQKIFELSDTISCGMTGDAEWGIQLANELFKNHEKLPSELIQIIKTFNNSLKEHSTFILAGKYDDGDLFLFGYKTEGGDVFGKNESMCLIATSPLELNDACLEVYFDCRDSGCDVKQSCIETIKFAASQNPKNISEEFDHLQILY